MTKVVVPVVVKLASSLQFPPDIRLVEKSTRHGQPASPATSNWSRPSGRRAGVWRVYGRAFKVGLKAT